ncbi:hypothetical protein [Paenibacillus aestuarii]|uniref:Uncharacterized protein n=1 Tax=Paenibacillus aestuarii TaxID=516965 RepID=A0ABW0K9K4_9BACL|nr:hypothetical protein [Paenibacillus aestuarii]
MRQKSAEEVRLTQSLNKLLDEMPLLEPSPAITDRVMRSIVEEKLADQPGSQQRRRRKEWVNSCIAAAATILLIQSGIMNKVLHLDAQMTHLAAYIEQLSVFLQF